MENSGVAAPVQQPSVSLSELIFTYLDMFWRRKLIIAILFPLVLVLGIAVVLVLPQVYRSSALILIEGQEIPQELVKSTVSKHAEQQIEVIQARILTVSKISDMIEEYGLYPSDTYQAPSELADRFRQNIEIEMISADLPGQWGGVTKTNVAFQMSFLDDSPVRAQQVASHLVTLFLDENVKSRVSKAAETSAFLQEEADKMQAEVSVLEDRMAAFKVEFSDSLPEMLQFNLQVVSTLEERLDTLQEAYDTAREQQQYLTSELSNTPRHLNAQGGDGLSVESSISQLRSQLQSLQRRYSESHPSVIRVKEEIQGLKEQRDADPEEVIGEASNPAYRRINRELDQVNAELERIEVQRQEVDSQLEDYHDRVERTYQVERGYIDLSRDYEARLEKYRELREKQLQAEVSESLEAENKSESFVLVEPPQVPDFPSEPNRVVLALGVLIAAAGASFGGAFAIELLNPRVRGASAITQLIGSEPMVVLPYISNTEDIVNNRATVVRWAVGMAIFLTSILLLFHFVVMPLDMLFEKVLNKLT